MPGTKDAIPLSIPATIAASPHERITLVLNTQLIPVYQVWATQSPCRTVLRSDPSRALEVFCDTPSNEALAASDVMEIIPLSLG